MKPTFANKPSSKSSTKPMKNSIGKLRLDSRSNLVVQPPKHPGEILKNQFMEPLGLTTTTLSTAIRVSSSRIFEILNARRGITAETALRLAKLFNTTPQAWLRLQSDYDLFCVAQKIGNTIDQEIQTIPASKNLNLTSIPAFAPSNSKQGHSSNNSAVHKKSPTNNVKLNSSQKKVYKLLSKEPIHFDALYNATDIGVGEMAANLTMLEIEGLVVRHPGDFYSKA
jgi:addiction module HigA family antidote